jgi:LysM repeat protein
MGRPKTPIRYLVIPLVLMFAILGTLMVMAQDSGYTVQRGDTLDTIAQRYNISLDALLAANGLSIDATIYPGDTLFIPIDAPAYGVALLDEASGGGGGDDGTAFLVQRGDTLDLIAAWYDVDLACLIEFNNITSPPLLQAGQIVVIPFNCPPYAGLSTAVPGALRGFEIGAGFPRPTRVVPGTGARNLAAPTVSVPIDVPTQEVATTQPQAFATLPADPNATQPSGLVTATPDPFGTATPTAQG